MTLIHPMKTHLMKGKMKMTNGRLGGQMNKSRVDNQSQARKTEAVSPKMNKGGKGKSGMYQIL